MGEQVPLRLVASLKGHWRVIAIILPQSLIAPILFEDLKLLMSICESTRCGSSRNPAHLQD